MSLDFAVTPAVKRVRLALDGDLVAEVDDLRRRVAVAKRSDMLGGGLADTAPQLERQLEQAELALEQNVKVFTFRGVGRAQFTRIVESHPPTQKQWDRWAKQCEITGPIGRPNPPEFDPETASIDMVAASCGDPQATPDEWAKLRDDSLTDGQWAELFRAALTVNLEASTRPLSVAATGTTEGGEPE